MFSGKQVLLEPEEEEQINEIGDFMLLAFTILPAKLELFLNEISSWL